MDDSHPGFVDAVALVVAKIGPGVAGSVVALRGLPPGSTFLDRVVSVLGGSASSYYVAPALIDWTGATGPNSYGLMAFGVGAFGLVLVGEITRAIREVQLAGLIRQWVRTKLGIREE